MYNDIIAVSTNFILISDFKQVLGIAERCNAPAGNYMFKVNNRNTRTRCEIC